MEGFPKLANFECHFGTEFSDHSVQTFGYEFVAKRNVTFSWESNVSLV